LDLNFFSGFALTLASKFLHCLFFQFVMSDIRTPRNRVEDAMAAWPAVGSFVAEVRDGDEAFRRSVARSDILSALLCWVDNALDALVS
jgi:hypothetical protein